MKKIKGGLTMTERIAKHATFVIERNYTAGPTKVYYAWADQNNKSKWFTKPEIFEFRVGGHEYSKGGPPEGPIFIFDVYYQDIVPEQRIVYTYTLDSDDKRLSVSIVTIELFPNEDRTKLVYTEQGAFFDGLDTPEIREHGTNQMLDALGRTL